MKDKSIGFRYNRIYLLKPVPLVLVGNSSKCSILKTNILTSNWGYNGDDFANNRVTFIHKFICAN